MQPVRVCGSWLEEEGRQAELGPVSWVGALSGAVGEACTDHFGVRVCVCVCGVALIFWGDGGLG